MKKIFFPICMCLISTGAMAVVSTPGDTTSGCTDQTTSDACYSKANNCWWNITGTGTGECIECGFGMGAAPDNGNATWLKEKMSVVATIENGTHPLFSWNYGEYNYCPWILSCDAGYVPYMENFSCSQCADDTFSSDRKAILVVKSDLAYEYNLATQKVTENEYGSSSGMGCTPCGANAHSNETYTDCVCDEHYWFAGGEHVGDNGCYAKIYNFYLHPSGPSTNTTDDFVSYEYKAYFSYNGNDGESVTLTEPSLDKKSFIGWFSGGASCAGQQYFVNNIATGNPIDIYDNDACKDYDGNNIHLHAKYDWKNYTVSYGDTSGHTQTCTYNSSCVIDYTPTTTVSDGRLFESWATDIGPEIKPGDDIVSLEQSINAEFENDTFVLTPKYKNCPAGYYCQSGQQYPCDEGRLCPEGSGSQGNCPAGSFCSPDAATPQYCTPGYYCPENSSAPTKCPVGSTSEAMATAKTKCFMTENTKFQDASGQEFKLLKSGAKVYVK